MPITPVRFQWSPDDLPEALRDAPIRESVRLYDEKGAGPIFALVVQPQRSSDGFAAGQMLAVYLDRDRGVFTWKPLASMRAR